MIGDIANQAGAGPAPRRVYVSVWVAVWGLTHGYDYDYEWVGLSEL